MSLEYIANETCVVDFSVCKPPTKSKFSRGMNVIALQRLAFHRQEGKPPKCLALPIMVCAVTHAYNVTVLTHRVLRVQLQGMNNGPGTSAKEK